MILYNLKSYCGNKEAIYSYPESKIKNFHPIL